MKLFFVANASDIKMQGSLRSVNAPQLISYFLFMRTGAKNPQEIVEMDDEYISNYAVQSHPRPASDKIKKKVDGLL